MNIRNLIDRRKGYLDLNIDHEREKLVERMEVYDNLEKQGIRVTTL